MGCHPRRPRRHPARARPIRLIGVVVVTVAIAAAAPTRVNTAPHSRPTTTTNITGGPGALVLIGPGGATKGQVVVPAHATWIERAAADQIVSSLLAATGVSLAVVREPDAPSSVPTLFVGNTTAAFWLNESRRFPAVLPEGFRVLVTTATIGGAARGHLASNVPAGFVQH
jgi:hypothetical protein